MKVDDTYNLLRESLYYLFINDTLILMDKHCSYSFRYLSKDKSYMSILKKDKEYKITILDLEEIILEHIKFINYSLTEAKYIISSTRVKNILKYI